MFNLELEKWFLSSSLVIDFIHFMLLLAKVNILSMKYLCYYIAPGLCYPIFAEKAIYTSSDLLVYLLFSQC